jgi:hypothetical protein
MSSPHHSIHWTRRDFLQAAGAGGVLPLLAGTFGRGAAAADEAKVIAAVVTEFRTNSHAEVIAARWLEGFDLDGQSERPRSRLAALYTDQVPGNDISRSLSEKHKVPIYPTIREALCRGGDKLAVDGVLLIGEHGKYPFNEKGQHMYPRRRLFEETVKVFRDSGRVVPVFSDKHLSYNWKDAKWMYDQAVELKIPFMAGSSLPGTWRRPALELDAGTDIEEGLAVGHGGVESYGFHALETLQCMMERRKGGETGVVAVQCLEGDAVWKAAEDKRWSRRLLEAALATGTEKTKPGAPEKNSKNPAVFIIEYKDGRRAAVLMLSGHTGDFLFAAQVVGRREPVATNFWLQDGRPHGHFTFLAQGIDRMFTTGKPSWPVERTLLTTGILDAVMTSRFEKHKRLETPHLVFAYSPGPAWTQPPLPRTGQQPKLQAE